MGILNAELIFTDVEVDGKDSLFHFFADRFYELGKISSREDFIAALYEREAMDSTYMYGGIAIPHGKSSCVKQPFLGMAKLKHPITWDDNPDEETETEIAFVIGVPKENEDNIHLKIIASICRRLSDDELVEALKEQTTATGVVELING